MIESDGQLSTSSQAERRFAPHFPSTGGKNRSRQFLLGRHHQNFVHTMPVHVENLEDVALRLKRLAFLRNVTERLDDEACKRLVFGVGIASKFETKQRFLHRFQINHRVNQP